jgi:lysophospholipase L1-like esterase
LKKFLQNFALIIFSFLLTFGFLEIGVRILNRHLGHYPQKDPILHHSLVPNAKLHRVNNEFDVIYKINSLGLRDEEFSVKKPPKTFRILMVGDSYTFGIGNNLEDTFVKRLEKKLNATEGSIHYQVINGGCSSYSPLLEYLFLIHKGIPLNPDLVILNYDISDVQDDYKYSKIAVRDAEGMVIRVPPKEVQYYLKELHSGYMSSIPFLQYSALYQFVMERVYQLMEKRDLPRFYQAANIIPGNIEYDRDLPMREGIGDWKVHFDRSAAYLKDIQQLLKEHGINFIITTYPYGNLVNEREWAIGRELRGFENKTYSTKLFDYLKDFCQSQGVPFLNMTPYFKDSKNFPLFYPYDGHFTPAGHEVAADALYHFLTEKKLLPNT